MKQYPIDKLRNVALVSHGGAGKTSLAEAILYTSGAIDRLGRVEEGNTVSDHDQEEIKRSVSISASLIPAEWQGHKINFIDTPGYFDFVGEVRGAMRVSDAAVVLTCAVSGVEVGTEKVWNYCNEYDIPRAFFINKMDRENANFARTLDALRQAFGLSVVPVTLPIGQEASFSGIVDLVGMKAYSFSDNGRKMDVKDIPANMADQVEEYRTALIEVVAETDDELLMKYLEGEALTDEEINTGVRAGIQSGKLVPVFCGSAQKNIGTQIMMDTIIHAFPSPAMRTVAGTSPRSGNEETRKPAEDQPFSALVFKSMADPYVGKLSLFRVYSGVFKSDSQVYNVNKDTTERIGQLFALRGKNQDPVTHVSAGDIGAVAKLGVTGTSDTLADKDHPIQYRAISFPEPVMSLAVEAKAKGDEEKIGTGLARLTEEDPTFTTRRDPETKQLVISGMGDLHLDVITSKLAKKFGAEVNLITPRVPYRETIRGTTKIEGKHKKQSGGKGQYGHVWLEMGPAGEPGVGLVFEDKIFGGSVPRQYIPAVEKGVRETMEEGVLAGYPVVDVQVALTDGSYHNVDSSEMAFKIASSMAFKKGFMSARPVLLEPIMNVEVTVPEQFMGDIIGDLNKKRGRILGMEPKGSFQVVRATVPLSEMFRYATDLRSMTQGRASFVMTPAQYEEVPSHIAEQIIAAAGKDEE